MVAKKLSVSELQAVIRDAKSEIDRRQKRLDRVKAKIDTILKNNHDFLKSTEHFTDLNETTIQKLLASNKRISTKIPDDTLGLMLEQQSLTNQKRLGLHRL